MGDLIKGWISLDQQPVRRVVGRRLTAPPGNPPSAAMRAAWDALHRHPTRAPKGIFFYQSHDQMTRDRERWTVEAVIEKQRERA